MTTQYNSPERGSSGSHPRPGPFVRDSRTTYGLDAHGLYRQAWEIIADDRIRELAEICDPEFRFTFPGIADATLDVMLSIAAQWRQAFSNLGQNRDDLTVFYDGDEKLATRDRHTLTHCGTFITADGQSLPASGNTITLFCAHFVRIRSNPQTRRNMIIRWDMIFDRLSLIEELQRSRSAPRASSR